MELKLSNITYRGLKKIQNRDRESEFFVIIDYFISITVHIASNSITINDIIDSIECQSIH